jgi:glycerophosphoryl diester phosphodiesterase
MNRLIASVSSLLLLGITAMADAQMIVAHRGASYDAPENTLAAFELAWQQGADAIEGDFYLTKDHHIVCVHDPDMKRTAGSNLVVAESALAELRKLDVGSWKGNRFADQRIPTLTEVCTTVPAGKKLFFEVKCGAEMVPVLAEALRESNFGLDQIVIISFQAAVVAEARKQLPEVESYWLTSFKKPNTPTRSPSRVSARTEMAPAGPNSESSSAWEPNVQHVIEVLKQTGATAPSCQAHEAVDQDFVRQLNDARYPFHCWTVNDPRLARRMIDLGVKSITTDRPGWLREQLGANPDSQNTSPNR